ncbi:MAG: hypothetical protein ABL926_13085 [Novosphingobium sp.]|uniref:hypothetical protein n=1 Tax=Novosphingobium sp. TaxID=1874826 RepID=UPI0032B87450
MLIRPELQALRSDDAPQRRAQTALGAVFAAWRATPAASTAEQELVRFADGSALEDLPLLAELFTPGDPAAAQFCAGLVEVILARLACDPLGQSPLRHFTDDTVTALTVLRCGTTTLALQAIDGAGLARRPAPVSAAFTPSETWEHVLAGEAEAETITIAGIDARRAQFVRRPLDLAPGCVHHRTGTREVVMLRAVARTLVSLKLRRRLPCSAVTYEYALDDGMLLHQAAGSPRESRLELSAALLGRMGRTDAAPLLAAMAEERGEASLRWQALRECLALDTEQGFAALARIAGRRADPLAHPAGALREQLIEHHPQLSEVGPCPA